MLTLVLTAPTISEAVVIIIYLGYVGLLNHAARPNSVTLQQLPLDSIEFLVVFI